MLRQSYPSGDDCQSLHDGWAPLGTLEPQPDLYRKSQDAEAFIQVLGAAVWLDAADKAGRFTSGDGFIEWRQR